jgi:hypothetical protein
MEIALLVDPQQNINTIISKLLDPKEIKDFGRFQV